MIQVEAMEAAVMELQKAGFSRQDAIELLKVQALSNVCEVLDNVCATLVMIQSAADELSDCVTETKRGSRLNIVGDVTNYEG